MKRLKLEKNLEGMQKEKTLDEEIAELKIDWNAKPKQRKPDPKYANLEYCIYVLGKMQEILPQIYFGLQFTILHPTSQVERKEAQKKMKIFDNTIHGMFDDIVKYADPRVTNLLVLKYERARSLKKLESD